MAIKETFDLVFAFVEKARNLEIKQAVLSIQEELQAQREANLALRDQNLTLKERIAELETASRQTADLQFDGKFYWLGEGATRTGPFCQVCFDRDRKRVRLPPSEPWNNGVRRDCNVCRQCFNE